MTKKREQELEKLFEEIIAGLGRMFTPKAISYEIIGPCQICGKLMDHEGHDRVGEKRKHKFVLPEPKPESLKIIPPK